MARAQALERSMRSRKKGRASLEDTPEHNQLLEFLQEVSCCSEGVMDRNSLETGQLFIKEVNHHCAEYKAGEDGEKAGNSCKRVDEAHLSLI